MNIPFGIVVVVVLVVNDANNDDDDDRANKIGKQRPVAEKKSWQKKIHFFSSK